MVKIILLALLTSVSAFSAIRIAAGVTRDNVNDELSAASAGDIIIIPPGTNDWTGTSAINVTKRVTFFSNTNTTLIARGDSNRSFTDTAGARYSGLRWYGYNANSVFVRFSAPGWIADHCFVMSSNVFCEAFQIYGISSNIYPWGVGYKNTLRSISPTGTTGPRFVSLSDGQVARSYYNVPSYFGESGLTNYPYIEDNLLMHALNCFDANSGGSAVIRYNTMIDTIPEWHSYQGSTDGTYIGFGAGTRLVELYMNTITRQTKAMNFPMRSRGATSVAFSNTVFGTWTAPTNFIIDEVRAIDPRGIYGRADGHPGNTSDIYYMNLCDGTNAVTDGSGTATSGSALLVLNDSTKSWTPGQFTPALAFANWLFNLSDGSNGGIATNTATSITVSNLSGGSLNAFSPGDVYFVTAGYPGRDQIGRGMDIGGWTFGSSSNGFPKQQLEPSYFWANKYGTTNVLPYAAPGSQSSVHIQLNRDYYNTNKPGYTPATYPHPMAVDPIISITSTDASVPMTNSMDFASVSSGNSPYTLTVLSNMTYNIQAPSVLPDRVFRKWTKNGVDFSESDLITVSVTANTTYNAIYGDVGVVSASLKGTVQLRGKVIIQ